MGYIFCLDDFLGDSVRSDFKKHLKLDGNEVHVWTIDPKLFLGASQLHLFKQLLNSQEQEKISRYRLPAAQHNALITRAFIRIILSQYSLIKPSDWCFSYSALGKPEIANKDCRLRFNLSHNNNLIVCAICLDNDIGCDIENLSRKLSIEPIASRFFSNEEAIQINALPDNLKRKGFFECWTLKESFVKATGLGISQGLDTFRFEFKTDHATDYRDDIKLFIAGNNMATTDWFNALLFPDSKLDSKPDSKHVIAVSVKSSEKQQINFQSNALLAMQDAVRVDL